MKKKVLRAEWGSILCTNPPMVEYVNQSSVYNFLNLNLSRDLRRKKMFF